MRASIRSVTPSLPQRGKQPKGSRPLDPRSDLPESKGTNSVFLINEKPFGTRRGGAPTGAAAFIPLGSMGVWNPYHGSRKIAIVMGNNPNIISYGICDGCPPLSPEGRSPGGMPL